MLELCRFCLYFSEFGYVTTLFYVPNFQKSYEHRKSDELKDWGLEKYTKLNTIVF